MNNLNDSALNVGGRFGRRSYLAWNMLLGFCLMIGVILIMALLPGARALFSPDSNMSLPAIVALILIYGAVVYFSIIFLIRRLHDRNHSGWLALLVLVPVINVLFGLYILFAPGNQDNNQFGQPRTTRGWESVLAILYILVIVLSVVAALAVPSYQDYVTRAQSSILQQP